MQMEEGEEDKNQVILMEMQKKKTKTLCDFKNDL